MLVALSGANWATMFRGKFLFMGLRSALVLVWESESSVVWHFLGTDSVDRPMTYDKRHVFHAKISSVTTEGIFSIQRRRHFVRIWTPPARVLAGSGSPGAKFREFYHLEQSDSQKIEYLTATPNTLSFAGGKYFTVNVGFILGKKDARLPTSPAGHFQCLLNMTEDWKVLMYGSADRRAWLVDGHTVLLHISIAYMFVRAQDRLSAFKYALLRSGNPLARSVLMDNRNLAIYQIPEARKIETTRSQGLSPSLANLDSDSAYVSGSNATSATIRQDSKSTESDFTFEMLVSQFYEVMRLMQATLSDWKQRTPQVNIRMPTTSPLLVGWEIADIIRKRSDLGKFGIC